MGLNTIRIEVKSSPQAFALKDELISAGLLWDRDFLWRYTPAVSDWDYENNQSAYVEFTFKDPALATYYRIKWQ